MRDLDASALRSLQRGPVLRPGDRGYDQARRVWNGMIDRRPALIARCSGAADVGNAVRWARERDLVVSVRGGGHSFPGHSVCDDGLMIDLQPMKSVRVDPVMQRVRAEPGVLWGELDRESQHFGLAVTGGMISHTGIAGLTLGGGFGWLVRRLGLAIDNLLSVDVVTADGHLVHASGEENPELFWGLRGGGGNFGIVTSLEYLLHPQGPVLGGFVTYPLGQARQVVRGFQEVMAEAPEELTAAAFWLSDPEGRPVVAIGPCYSGADLRRGEAIVAPLRELGDPVADEVGPMAYTAVQSLLDEATAHGLRYYMRSNLVNTLDDEAVALLSEAYARVPSPLTGILLVSMGGTVGRVPSEATAYPHREARYTMTVMGTWTEPGDDDANITWVRGLWDGLRPHLGDHVYVNELHEEGSHRIRAAYGAPAFTRLQALKQKYDPDNFFRLNQNIPPTRTAHT